MSDDFFKIPKLEHLVSFWIHPEGRVPGTLFLREQSLHHIGEESPVELLNQTEPFVVINRQDLNELRFYSKASIVRVEYQHTMPDNPDLDAINAEIHMMDGSLITGQIRGSFCPDRARLYDYLNKIEDHFVVLYQEQDQVTLINKKYVIYAKSI